MQTISIKSIAAASEIASTIEGFGPEILLTRQGFEEEGVIVRPLGEYADSTELRLGDSARVTIDRPRVAFNLNRADRRGAIVPARVTWSSSNSNSNGLAAAETTVELLAFAVEVAKQLQAWADEGALPRLVA
jgi:hypothetical protein